MKSLKPLQWAAVALSVTFFFYVGSRFFGGMLFLGGILLLEVVIACLWNYEQRFLVLLMVLFLWAGISVPMQSVGGIGRWAVLAAGAGVGCIIWLKSPHRHLGPMHLIALFCVSAAFVSATVSPFTKMSSLKALSLLLLFLYCSTGVRLAAIGRERLFFHGLVWGTEIVVYATAICYFVLGLGIWGNSNSLGAAMSIACFPILLWAWLTTDGPSVKLRRLVALLLCTYLIRFSLERAGMVSAAIVTLIFCVCLHQYKLLVKLAAVCLVLIAGTGMLAPQTLSKQFEDLSDALLYKGHKMEGVLGSRRSPWETSIATIKAHPLFGTGYGTSPTGEDPGLSFGTFRSTSETEREHGSSYMTIAEWVGLLGVLPFAALIGLTILNVWRVCAWMNRTANPRHYSIPLAMVVLSGLAHANFEDWLFAVGSYLSLFFWICAFLLADLVPAKIVAPAAAVFSRAPRPSSAALRPIASNQ